MYFELDYTYNVQRLYMRNLIWEKSERIKRNTLIDQGKILDDGLPIIQFGSKLHTPKAAWIPGMLFV